MSHDGSPTWVPIGNMHDEEAWDDSALIRAYDGAMDAYQVSR